MARRRIPGIRPSGLVVVGLVAVGLVAVGLVAVVAAWLMAMVLGMVGSVTRGRL